MIDAMSRSGNMYLEDKLSNTFKHRAGISVKLRSALPATLLTAWFAFQGAYSQYTEFDYFQKLKFGALRFVIG
jgi:hypothetical protein